MGVYIKGMEMPSCCMFCPVSNSVGCGLANPPIIMTSKEMLAGRPDWCSLISVPESHGRLVDADVYEKLLRGLGNRDYRREAGTLQDAIKLLHPHYAPTIIPAEPQKEEI